MLKSPLKYPGSKGRAMDQIAPLIPEFNEYRECFLGGGSIYLYVRQKYGKDKRYWINDIYYDLINFWKCTRQSPNEMIDILMKWKNKFEENGRQLQQFLKVNSYRFNDIELASAFFVSKNIGFSGFSRGYSEDNFKKFTESKIKKLKDISDLLQNTKITNYDYQKLVEKDGDDVFIMCDPPYYDVKWNELYGTRNRNLHASFDHYKFSRLMKNCEHKFLITYDDSQFIREQFKWANITSWELLYTSRHVKTGKELFISNYELPKIGNEVKIRQFTLEDSWGGDMK